MKPKLDTFMSVRKLEKNVLDLQVGFCRSTIVDSGSRPGRGKGGIRANFGRSVEVRQLHLSTLFPHACNIVVLVV